MKADSWKPLKDPTSQNGGMRLSFPHMNFREHIQALAGNIIPVSIHWHAERWGAFSSSHS